MFSDFFSAKNDCSNLTTPASPSNKRAAKKKSPPKARRQRALQGIQMLEAREMMATDLAANLSERVLRIEGTDAPDQIQVVQSGNRISIEGIAIQSNGQSFTSLSVDAVDRILVDGLGDDDHIFVEADGQPFLPLVEVLGSSGNDLLHSQGSVVPVGLANGLQKVIQARGHLYSLDQQGQLFENGAPVTFGGYSLSNLQITVGDTGLLVEGEATLPVVGKVRFKGSIDDAGNYSLKTDVLPPIQLLGGMVKLDQIVVTLTPQGAILTAHADVAGIAQADLTGFLTADGNYALTGKGSVQLGPISAGGIDFTLGNTDVGFTVPVPSIGNVKVKGSYRPDGQWSIEGTYPETVVVGGIPLRNITVGVGADSFTVGAETGVPGILDARVTGTMYYDGRFTLVGTANAVELGGFRLGSAIVKVSNDPATTGLRDRTVRITLDGAVGIPNGPSIRLNGFVDGTGNYELKGSDTLKVGGLTLQQTEFTLKKGQGLSFKANWNYYIFNAAVTGTVQSNGQVHFEGTAQTGKLGAINLGQVRAVVDLNPVTNVYKMDFYTTVNAFVATVKFEGHASRDAQGNWQTPTLTGTAAVNGALASILSGSATFTLTSSSLTFRGSLKLPLNLGAITVQGAVYSDGTVQIGSTRVNAGRITAEEGARILLGLGANPGQIVGTLVQVYQTTLNTMARILNTLKVSVPEIAKALYNHAGAAGRDLARLTIALWQHTSATINQVASALWNHTSATTNQVASALWKYTSATVSQVASALWTQTNATINQVASALWKHTSATINQVASALWKHTSASVSQVASALWHYTSATVNQVASALWNHTSTTINQVASALWNQTNATINQVASALWKHTSASVHQVASAVWNYTSASVRQVASAIWHYTGASFNQAVSAVCNATGVSWGYAWSVVNGV